MAIKKYRVSGFMDEIGAVQSDIEAISKKQAELKAYDEQDFTEIVSITKIV